MIVSKEAYCSFVIQKCWGGMKVGVGAVISTWVFCVNKLPGKSFAATDKTCLNKYIYIYIYNDSL